MITTVTTTVTTVTSVILASSLSMIVILLLLVFLVQKEIISVANRQWWDRMGRVLNILIIPLAIAFATIVAVNIGRYG